MTNVGVLVVSLLLAWLIVAAFSKSTKKKWFSALLVKGKNGRVGITLVPHKKHKRRRSK